MQSIAGFWFLGSLLLSLATAVAEIPAAAWRTTDLDASVARLFLANDKCYSDAKYLWSCVRAVNAAGSALQIERRMVLDGLAFNIASAPFGDLQEIAEAQVAEQFADLSSTFHFAFEAALAEVVAARPPALPAQMFWGLAITAHLATYDAHAAVYPSRILTGQFPRVELGISSVVKTAQGYVVQTLVPDGPGARAGLRVGDVLVSIDRLANSPLILAEVNFAEAAATIQSVTTKELKIGILRSGVPLPVTVQPRKAPANDDAYILPERRGVGYIRIRQFVDGRTCGWVRSQLRRLADLGARAWIIDVRDNLGGLQTEAVCTAGIFIGTRVVAVNQARSPEIPEFQMIPTFYAAGSTQLLRNFSGVALRQPVVLLLNRNSASSAELFAAALQYHQAAWLVGERTFGKAVAQTYGSLPGHPSLMLAATSSRIFQPGGLTYQGVGVQPSFPLETGEDLNMALTPQREENITMSLPALNPPFFDPRTEEIQRIRSCLDGQGVGQLGENAVAVASAIFACE